MTKSMRKALKLAILSILLGAAAGRTQAGTTTNLLSNPGAEAGSIAGWTVGGTSNPGVDSGSFDPGINPNSGTFDFYGHTGASGTLTQDVTLVGTQGITAALIDNGTTVAGVSFFEQGLNQGTPSDDARVTLSFLDGSSTVLSSVSTPEADSHNGAWQNFTGSFAIPIGTRTIAYTMEFIRHSGNDLDAFVDDNSLVVTTRAATVGTPEPSTVISAGVAVLAGLGAMVCRRRIS